MASTVHVRLSSVVRLLISSVIMSKLPLVSPCIETGGLYYIRAFRPPSIKPGILIMNRRRDLKINSQGYEM